MMKNLNISFPLMMSIIGLLQTDIDMPVNLFGRSPHSIREDEETGIQYFSFC